MTTKYRFFPHVSLERKPHRGWQWLLACIGLILFQPMTAHAADIACRVVGVADGDTLNCLTASKQNLRVRLHQIDAPERGQPFSNASRKALADLVAGKQVLLQSAGQDRYGRVLATVQVQGLNVNQQLVRQGHAWAYRQYLVDRRYLQLEAQARSETLGLWSQPGAIYPADYRKGIRSAAQNSIVLDAPAPRTRLLPLMGAGQGSHCGSKRFCNQMNSCAEARYYLNQCGITRLDRDGDGIPCENLCTSR